MIDKSLLRQLQAIVGSVDYGLLLINGENEVPDWLRNMVENPEEYDRVEYKTERDLHGWEHWATGSFTYNTAGETAELSWCRDGVRHIAPFYISRVPEPEKTPRHVEWALEEIRTQSKGLDNYSEGIWVWSSHSDYEWIVIDRHGTIRCFDHIETAVRYADGLYWESDDWHNAPAFLIYKDMAWNANEIHVLHKAIKEREQ